MQPTDPRLVALLDRAQQGAEAAKQKLGDHYMRDLDLVASVNQCIGMALLRMEQDNLPFPTHLQGENKIEVLAEQLVLTMQAAAANNADMPQRNLPVLCEQTMINKIPLETAIDRAVFRKEMGERITSEKIFAQLAKYQDIAAGLDKPGTDLQQYRDVVLARLEATNHLHLHAIEQDVATQIFKQLYNYEQGSHCFPEYLTLAEVGDFARKLTAYAMVMNEHNLQAGFSAEQSLNSITKQTKVYVGNLVGLGATFEQSLHESPLMNLKGEKVVLLAGDLTISPAERRSYANSLHENVQTTQPAPRPDQVKLDGGLMPMQEIIKGIEEVANSIEGANQMVLNGFIAALQQHQNPRNVS